MVVGETLLENVQSAKRQRINEPDSRFTPNYANCREKRFVKGVLMSDSSNKKPPLSVASSMFSRFSCVFFQKEQVEESDVLIPPLVLKLLVQLRYLGPGDVISLVRSSRYFSKLVTSTTWFGKGLLPRACASRLLERSENNIGLIRKDFDALMKPLILARELAWKIIQNNGDSTSCCPSFCCLIARFYRKGRGHGSKGKEFGIRVCFG